MRAPSGQRNGGRSMIAEYSNGPYFLGFMHNLF
jgi:hypothetical protein